MVLKRSLMVYNHHNKLNVERKKVLRLYIIRIGGGLQKEIIIYLRCLFREQHGKPYIIFINGASYTKVK